MCVLAFFSTSWTRQVKGNNTVSHPILTFAVHGVSHHSVLLFLPYSSYSNYTKVCGSHSCVAEASSHLEWRAMLRGKQFPTLQSTIVHSFLFILLGLLDPEDEGTTIFPYFGSDLPSYAA